MQLPKRDGTVSVPPVTSPSSQPLANFQPITSDVSSTPPAAYPPSPVSSVTAVDDIEPPPLPADLPQDLIQLVTPIDQIPPVTLADISESHELEDGLTTDTTMPDIPLISSSDIVTDQFNSEPQLQTPSPDFPDVSPLPLPPSNLDSNPNSVAGHPTVAEKSSAILEEPQDNSVAPDSGLIETASETSAPIPPLDHPSNESVSETDTPDSVDHPSDSHSGVGDSSIPISPDPSPPPSPSDPPVSTNPIDTASPQADIPQSDAPPPTSTSTDNSIKSKNELLVILNKNNILTEEQVADIQLQILNTGKSAEQILEEQQMVTKLDLLKARAELFEIPFADANEITTSTEAMALVPQSVARKFVILPFDYKADKNELSVAMADATDLGVISFLEKKTQAKVIPYASSPEALAQLIEERYGASLSTEVHKVIKETELGRSVQMGPAPVSTGVIREAPIAKIVSYVLEYAMKTKSSDVHIEAQEERTRVRFRIDGILHEKLVLPKQVHEALVSRIKILSGMKIDEKRVPQDGRFNFSAENEEIDLRVSSLPTVHGEKIVMRLLKKTGGAVSLSDLGMRGRALKNFEEAALKPHGIVLVTGPTGSGKTTTLYSVITKINTPKVNILTLEDPVEYQMKGVNQVQINPQAGLTFASGLRSFLRQDPNIIMVGEIRDSETADLAIQASLTGHLVFSTLHTNSAAGALPRLLDMGTEPFLLASTINAVVAQRVVRKICTNCKVEYQPPGEIVEDIKKALGSLFPKDSIKNLSKGEGCADCNSTGYQGRIGIYEVLPVTEKIGKLILEHAPASHVEKQAIEEGMITMQQDGYMKVIEGATSIEEVLRVAQD